MSALRKTTLTCFLIRADKSFARIISSGVSGIMSTFLHRTPISATRLTILTSHVLIHASIRCSSCFSSNSSLDASLSSLSNSRCLERYAIIFFLPSEEAPSTKTVRSYSSFAFEYHSSISFLYNSVEIRAFSLSMSILAANDCNRILFSTFLIILHLTKYLRPIICIFHTALSYLSL